MCWGTELFLSYTSWHGSIKCNPKTTAGNWKFGSYSFSLLLPGMLVYNLRNTSPHKPKQILSNPIDLNYYLSAYSIIIMYCFLGKLFNTVNYSVAAR